LRCGPVEFVDSAIVVGEEQCFVVDVDSRGGGGESVEGCAGFGAEAGDEWFKEACGGAPADVERGAVEVGEGEAAGAGVSVVEGEIPCLREEQGDAVPGDAMAVGVEG